MAQLKFVAQMLILKDAKVLFVSDLPVFIETVF